MAVPVWSVSDDWVEAILWEGFRDDSLQTQTIKVSVSL